MPVRSTLRTGYIFMSQENSPAEQPSEPLPEEVREISAAELVSDDTDRPVADNTAIQGSPLDRPDDPTEKPKKRGRPKLSDEEKARRAAERQKAPPDFGDIGGRPTGQAVPIKPPRNYGMEAAQLFIPVSSVLGKLLGPHWGIEVDQEKKEVKFTPEQSAYLASMAAWLEYEQFPEINPRWGFAIATAAYMIPKVKTDPTPERLKIAWIKVSGWFKRIFTRKRE